MISIEEFGAKSNPFESVVSHLLRTGIVANEGLKNSFFINYKKVLQSNIIGLDEVSLENFVSYIIAMHDIGKIHPGFQEIIPNMPECLKRENVYAFVSDEKWRHEFQSNNYILNLGLFKKRGIPKKLLENLSTVILKHHDRKGYHSIDLEELFEDNEDAQTFWEDKVNEMEEIIFNYFPFDGSQITEIKNMDIVCSLIWGYLVLCDWLSSSANFSKYALNDVLKNKKIIDELFVEYGFEVVKKDFKGIGFSDLLKINPQDLKLRSIQKWCVDYCKNNTFDLCIVEGGTGIGKTSIGLYMALSQMNETEGFYFALPMQTMVNSKYFELRDVFRPFGMHLTMLHGNRDLVEDVEDEYSYYSEELKQNIDVNDFLTRSSRRGLLNRFIVGTIDQLLFSVLPNRYFILRLLGLVGKTIIIDELHAYDMYTSGILFSLLSWCKVLNIKVILMSATLTKGLKEKYLSKYIGKSVSLRNEGYPLITVVKKDIVTEIPLIEEEKDKTIFLQSVDVLSDISKEAELIYKYYQEDTNIVVYKNTVNEAQKLYRACKDKGITDIILCHSRFTIKDRSEKEKVIVEKYGKKNINNRPKKSVVISTQVLEASMDIDFDMGFSDIAPIDILVQRMGRVCRFNLQGNNRYNFYIFTSFENKFGTSDYIYPKLFLLNTNKYLKDKKQIILTKELRESINNVYQNIDLSDEKIAKLYMEEYTKNKVKESMAISNALSSPNELQFSLGLSDYEILNEDDKNQHFYSTRLFDESYTVLCIGKNEKELLEKYNSTLSFKYYKELMKYTLSISGRYIKPNLLSEDGSSKLEFGKERFKNILILPLKNNQLFVQSDRIKGYRYSFEYGLEILRKE